MEKPLLLQLPKSIEDRFRPDAEIVLFHGDVSVSDPNSGPIYRPDYHIASLQPRQGIRNPRVAMEQYLQEQAEVIAQLYRVLRDDGSICWQVGNFVEDGEVFPLDILYYPIFKSLGLKLRNRIIWRFGHRRMRPGAFPVATRPFSGLRKVSDISSTWTPCGPRPSTQVSAITKGPTEGNHRATLWEKPSDVWEILVQDWEEAFWDIPNVKSNHPEKTIHPCQFPIELVERCVLALTNEGDWVFDPYMGVGSALIAAVMHNRRAMGSEKEKDYVEIARQRLLAYFNGTLRYRPMGKPIYQPTGREKVAQVPRSGRIWPFPSRDFWSQRDVTDEYCRNILV